MIATVSNAQALLLLVQGLIVLATAIGMCVLWMAVRYELADQRQRRAAETVTRISDYTRRQDRPAA